MGGTACSTEPGSVMIRGGRKLPATTGVSGVVSSPCLMISIMIESVTPVSPPVWRRS